MAEAATAPRSGRPKSEEKADAILCAASELFLSQGYQGTSMDAVAQRAGVSKQTVYSHFANKEVLFTRCIESKVAGYGFEAGMGEAGADLREALLGITRRFVDLLFDPDVVAMHRVVMAEAASQPRIAELFFDSGPKKTKAAVVDFLAKQVARGQLRISEDRLLYAAFQLLNTAFGMYQLPLWLGLLHEVDAAEREAHLSRVVDDFLALYGVDSTEH